MNSQSAENEKEPETKQERDKKQEPEEAEPTTLGKYKGRPKCGCGKTASFNFEGWKPWFCGSCKQSGMVNLVSRRCARNGCIRQPLYNVPGETVPQFCGACKSPEMVNVVFRKCASTTMVCSKYPAFNFPGEKAAMYCQTHKLPGMINLLARKCSTPDCLRQPLYNFEGQKLPKFCSTCKAEGMVDVINQRCLTPLCGTFAQVKHYRGYCVRCFMHHFPEEPVARNYKTKEAAVHAFLVQRFPSVTWTWDKRVDGGCSAKRPDFVLHLGSHVIVVEVDEGQHHTYGSTCENKRTMMLSQDLGHVPLVLIRFNPDQYTSAVGEKISSCWAANGKGILVVKPSKLAEWNARLDKLAAEVEKFMGDNVVVEKTVEQVRLFYNDFSS